MGRHLMVKLCATNAFVCLPLETPLDRINLSLTVLKIPVGYMLMALHVRSALIFSTPAHDVNTIYVTVQDVVLLSSFQPVSRFLLKLLMIWKIMMLYRQRILNGKVNTF